MPAGCCQVTYNELGKTGRSVSRLSFGASALGDVYGPVDESAAIEAVEAALECGINYFDVAPAYGATLAEARLGKALRGTPRHRYFLSTKVGKYLEDGPNGAATLDYSRRRIRQALEESLERLGVDCLDFLYIHDIEYQGGRYTKWALDEGLETVLELKREGRVGAVGFGFYPADLWRHVLSAYPIDVALIHNHHCLHDTRLLELLPLAQRNGVGVVNGSPFASGLLTELGAPEWHPASPEARACFRAAADFCRNAGSSLSQLAIQFATQNPAIPTTLFSSADPGLVFDNVRWSEQPLDQGLLKEVQRILAPVRDQDWNYV